MKAPGWARTFVIAILPIGVIVGGTFGIYAFLSSIKPQPEQAEQEVRSLAVFVEHASLESLRLSVSTQGEVRPRREIDVIPQVAGKLEYLAPSFVAGGFFEDGDVLMRIEEADYRLAVTRADAEVARARRALDRENAEAAIARRDWAEIGEGEASSLTLHEPQLAEARAVLAAARAQLQDAQLQLSRTTITAPFSGRVREKLADVGQYVTPGQRLGRIFSTDVVEIRVPLSDNELALLDLPIAFQETEDNPGADVILSATLAGRMRTWSGRIVRTDSAIDTQSRTLFAFAEVEDPYGAGADDGMPLAVGLFVSAEIQGREVENAISLPRAALRGNDQAFVAREDGTLDIRTVSVVTSDREKVVFNSGIEAGDYVVTSPILTPRQGMAVEAYTRGGELLFPLPDEDNDDDSESPGDTDEAAAVAAATGDDGDRT